VDYCDRRRRGGGVHGRDALDIDEPAHQILRPDQQVPATPIRGRPALTRVAHPQRSDEDPVLGQLPEGMLYLLRVAVLSAIYNAVLTPILYPVLRRVTEASRPKKVYRW
jgi:hypothetical protein